MKIDLIGPYAILYSIGYLRSDNDGRKRVDLKNSNLDRTTITYAKYLMSIKLNRVINGEIEEVDHIDNNCSNDNIENLQLLSPVEHKIKTGLERGGRTYVSCLCAYCDVYFQREVRQTKKGYKNTFCSRSCNGKYHASIMATPSKR